MLRSVGRGVVFNRVHMVGGYRSRVMGDAKEEGAPGEFALHFGGGFGRERGCAAFFTGGLLSPG